MKNIIAFILFLLILGGCLYIQWRFFPRKTVRVETETMVDTIYQDTVITEYIPDPYPVEVISPPETVKIPADTAELIKKYLALHNNYFSTYTYKDTLKDDTLAFVEVESKITQNKPIKYNLRYFDRTPSVINKEVKIYHQNEFYVGISNTAPSVLFKSKKGFIVGAGYDPLNKNVQVHGYINLDKIVQNGNKE